jgi:hypothetical protein
MSNMSAYMIANGMRPLPQVDPNGPLGPYAEAQRQQQQGKNNNRSQPAQQNAATLYPAMGAFNPMFGGAGFGMQNPYLSMMNQKLTEAEARPEEGMRQGFWWGALGSGIGALATFKLAKIPKFGPYLAVGAAIVGALFGASYGTGNPTQFWVANRGQAALQLDAYDDGMLNGSPVWNRYTNARDEYVRSGAQEMQNLSDRQNGNFFTKIMPEIVLEMFNRN